MDKFDKNKLNAVKKTREWPSGKKINRKKAGSLKCLKLSDENYNNSASDEPDVSINDLFGFLKLRDRDQNERIKVESLEKMINNYDKPDFIDSINNVIKSRCFDSIEYKTFVAAYEYMFDDDGVNIVLEELLNNCESKNILLASVVDFLKLVIASRRIHDGIITPTRYRTEGEHLYIYPDGNIDPNKTCTVQTQSEAIFRNLINTDCYDFVPTCENIKPIVIKAELVKRLFKIAKLSKKNNSIDEQEQDEAKAIREIIPENLDSYLGALNLLNWYSFVNVLIAIINKILPSSWCFEKYTPYISINHLKYFKNYNDHIITQKPNLIKFVKYPSREEIMSRIKKQESSYGQIADKRENKGDNEKQIEP